MPSIIRVTVDAQGSYFINDEALSYESLKIRFSDLAKEKPDSVIAIHADKNVAYGAVAQLLDLSREMGLSKVGFETEYDSK